MPLLLVATVCLLGIGLGGAWEVVEWAYDQWLAPGNFRRRDTAIDLLLDAGGSLVAGVALAVAVRPR